MTQQPPAQRWFQFRLRTLFFATALAAIVVAGVRSELTFLETFAIAAVIALALANVVTDTRTDQRRIP